MKSVKTTNMEISDLRKDIDAKRFAIYSDNTTTLQMVMKWLREVHNILIVVDYEWECNSTPYYFKIYRLGKNGKPERVPIRGVSYDKNYHLTEHIVGYRDWERSHDDYSTYEEACEAAIKYCLLENQKKSIPVPDKINGLKSLMLQYLQSAANRKDDTEIENDTNIWAQKILDYLET